MLCILKCIENTCSTCTPAISHEPYPLKLPVVLHDRFKLSEIILAIPSAGVTHGNHVTIILNHAFEKMI